MQQAQQGVQPQQKPQTMTDLYNWLQRRLPANEAQAVVAHMATYKVPV
jgi:hypothetical protein